ncbi:MAG: acetyl-CoA carboxylase biotin carboxyl carrier protein [Firmicutes bacterium HGW-Firmicutes-21]|nr:MAG: acetyl-CoA carboxylase biotin carboxyl carrier protein [Firmicutes bacterium HGW-Firmicutes-21]
MDLKQIEALAKIMNKNALSALEITEGELKISMKKDICEFVPQTAPKEVSTSTDIPKVEKAEAEEKTDKNGYSFNALKEINSPLAGVFYSSPSPESPPFVKVGDKVKKGDVLCIVEAMKLMNELTAETDGEIADICVENEQIVEFGQTLFTIF